MSYSESPTTISAQSISSLSVAVAELKSPESSSGNHAISEPYQSYIQQVWSLANRSPRQLGYPFRRWTIPWLNYHLRQEYSLQVSDRHLGQALQQLGLSIQATSTSPADWMPPRSRITIGDLAT